MKSILIASLLVALAATSSFGGSAASSLTDAGKTVMSGTATIGKLSTGVHMAHAESTAGYAIITQHINGVKKFGTAYDSTAVTWMTATKNTAVAVPGASNSTAVTGAGWSVM